MTFEEIFVKYWDQAITGFIGGLVVYILTLKGSTILGVSLNNKLVRAVYTFLVAIILVTVYSTLVYFF